MSGRVASSGKNTEAFVFPTGYWLLRHGDWLMTTQLLTTRLHKTIGSCHVFGGCSPGPSVGWAPPTIPKLLQCQEIRLVGRAHPTGN